MKVLAFECYADQDVCLFLKETLAFPFKRQHSYSQGEVINDLLKKGRADIGLVDEDPGASHRRGRDAMPVVATTTDVELRSRGDRHLFILKPNVERCFLKGVARLGLPSELPSTASDLERRLAHPDNRHADHKLFRRELELLHRESVSKKTPTFLTDLEHHLRQLP